MPLQQGLLIHDTLFNEINIKIHPISHKSKAVFFHIVIQATLRKKQSPSELKLMRLPWCLYVSNLEINSMTQ